ncbi:hypothetical protein DMUE_0823 [Dictyocoela muelleri]|nr:hypothetical protein DMUE_0823 [Dictyocoela muelleri]
MQHLNTQDLSRKTSAPSHNLNKKTFKKHSLYNQLLSFGRISPESVKLNSTEKDFREENLENSYIPQKIEFTHTPLNTTISIKRTYSMLEDIQRQDLFRWRNEFMQTVKLTRWEEQTAVEVLKSSIGSKYYDLIEDFNTVNDIMIKISKKKKNFNHYLKYLNMLSNIKQDDFLTIKEYKDYIHKICIRLQTCMDWSDSQMENIAEEIFYNGISKRTQCVMSRLNVQSILEIYKMINCTEETLLEQNIQTNEFNVKNLSLMQINHLQKI